MRIRFWKSAVLIAAAFLLMHVCYAQGTLEGIDKHKLTIKSYLDFGHLVNGYNYYDPDAKYDIAWQPLSRANVTAIQDLTLGQLDVSVGLTALIWWPYGGGKNADLTEKVMQAKPMIPVARARWQFGNPAAMSGSIQVGVFNYKYNPDAKDLGEYLYRSGTYPGVIWNTEGWLLMNRAGNYSNGLLGTVSQMGGALKHNLSLFMETTYYPVGDFSPGYDFSLTQPWFEIGGGAVFNHYLPLRPSLLTPKENVNTYATIHGKNSAGVDTVATGRLDEILGAVATPETIDTLSHWTFKGIKLMGRAALKLGSLIPEQYRGPDDLRIFAEIALLGVENQPLYYEKRSERMPIMFGINIPTAKMLDVLCIQGEYYKSPYNDITKFSFEAKPIPQTGATPSGKNTIRAWGRFQMGGIRKKDHEHGFHDVRPGRKRSDAADGREVQSQRHSLDQFLETRLVLSVSAGIQLEMRIAI